MFKMRFAGVILMAMAILGMSHQEAKADISLLDSVSCDTSISSKYTDTPLFNQLLTSKHIPLSITLSDGRTLSVWKDRLINYCELVYGDPWSIVDNGKRHQMYDAASGEYFYLGYDINGNMYLNWRYPDTYRTETYIRDMPFIYQPWNNSTIVSQANNPSFTKPYPEPPGYASPQAGYTVSYELSRAIDRMYYPYHIGGNPAGYFPSRFGSNLVNYAAVDFFPTDYSVGQFELYFTDPTNPCVIRFGSFTMANHKNIFEQPDLELLNSFIITPSSPQHTNQPASVTLQVKNNSSDDFSNVVLAYGWSSSTGINATQGTTTFNINGGQTVNVTISGLKYPKTNAISSTQYFSAYVNPNNDNPTNESNTSNNSHYWSVTVNNPNAYMTLNLVNNQNLYATVHNDMMKPIDRDCPVTSGTDEICRTGTSNTTAYIKVYDTNQTVNTSDDTLVRTVPVPNYHIAPGGTYDIPIPAEVQNSNIVKRYRVEAQIAEYKGEVDLDGNASYNDNHKTDFYMVYAPYTFMPSDLSTCNQLNVSYVNAVNGVGPIKSCAGQYPKYPSTQTEIGMQVYHFVLWRFFPLPLPPYTVTTPNTDPTKADYFRQGYTLNEPNNTQGNSKTFIYYPTGSNTQGLPGPYTNAGGYTYRGRLMPMSANFTFSVYDTVKNSSSATGYSKNALIAFGTLAYDIDSSCYNNTVLDLVHKYGCDEIMFFVPNAQNNMYVRPSDHTGPIDFISDPITDTKIPYLNPGKYIFDVNATEKFQYRYQFNNTSSGYSWQQVGS